MERGEALQQIEGGLAEGKSRRELFDDLSPNVKFKSDLIEWIAAVPHPEAKARYSKINSTLFALLVFITVLKFISALLWFGKVPLMTIIVANLGCILSAYFAFLVWTYRGKFYRAIGILAFVNVLKSFDADLGTIGILLNVIPLVLSALLSFYLAQNLFPYYEHFGSVDEKKLFEIETVNSS